MMNDRRDHDVSTHRLKLGWPGIWSLGALELPVGFAIVAAGGDGFVSEVVLMAANGRCSGIACAKISFSWYGGSSVPIQVRSPEFQ